MFFSEKGTFSRFYKHLDRKYDRDKLHEKRKTNHSTERKLDEEVFED